MGKKTPLFEVYAESGAKTIDFGGWDLPVQFSGIKEEHEAVRTRAGIFDVSHMGEIEVTGPETLEFLQYVMTNDVKKVKDGRCQYTAVCYETGGTVDDLVWYKRSDESALLVVNAANEAKDFEWLLKHSKDFNVQVSNVSSHYAQIALQGPLANQIAQRLSETDLKEIRFFSFKEGVTFANASVLISRTGYTGEDGFEIYCNPNDASHIWKTCLSEGEEEGIQPCGLGARDTLRFEATLPLYGQELSSNISPVEAGIGFAVKTDVDSRFIGKDVLARQKEDGPLRKSVGIEMIDKGIPRHGYAVSHQGMDIGEVTSGTQSPTLGKNIGLALIDQKYASEGTEVEVQIRKKTVRAKVVQTPFYKKA